MNKYQEALNAIKESRAVESIWNSKIENYCRNEVETLQELVDKATPKKPINDKCPSCQSIHIYYRESRDSLWLVRLYHCPHCGQALKWSNDGPTK